MKMILLFVVCAGGLVYALDNDPCESSQSIPAVTDKEPCGMEGSCKTFVFSTIEELEAQLSSEMREFLTHHIPVSDTEVKAFTSEAATSEPMMKMKTFTINCTADDNSTVIEVQNCDTKSSDVGAMSDVKQDCDGNIHCRYTSTCKATYDCIDKGKYFVSKGWYNESNNLWYRMSAEPLVFQGARENCRRFGADLARNRQTVSYSSWLERLRLSDSFASSSMWVHEDHCINLQGNEIDPNAMICCYLDNDGLSYGDCDEKKTYLCEATFSALSDHSRIL